MEDEDRTKPQITNELAGMRSRVTEFEGAESEQNRAEEDLRLFRSLINQSYDAVFVIDPETGRFLYVNDRACSNLGYTREELLNMTVVDIEEVIPDNSLWEKHIKETPEKGGV